MFDPARADEAVADRLLAGRLHVHVGSALRLLAGQSNPTGFDFVHAVPLTVRVVGIAVTRNNVGPVTAFASQASLLVTPALLHGLSPDIHVYDAAFVGLSTGASVAAFGSRARALVSVSDDLLFLYDDDRRSIGLSVDAGPVPSGGSAGSGGLSHVKEGRSEPRGHG